MKSLKRFYLIGLSIYITINCSAQQVKAAAATDTQKNDLLAVQLWQADSFMTLTQYDNACKKYAQLIQSIDNTKNPREYLNAGLRYYEALTALNAHKNSKKRLTLLDTLDAFASKKKDRKAQGIISLKYADYYQFKDKIKSLQHALQSEKLLLAIQDSVPLVTLYNLKAQLFRSNLEYEKAANQLQMALIFITDQHKPKEITRTYARLLREFLFQEFPISKNWLPFYLESEAFCDTNKGDPQICKVVHLNAALLYAKSNEPEKAVTILERHINLDALKSIDPPYNGKFPYFAQYVTGYVYLKVGKEEKALKHLLIAKEFCVQQKDSLLRSMVSESLTDIYLNQGYFIKAKKEIAVKRKIDVKLLQKTRKSNINLEDIIANLQKEKKLKTQENTIKTLATNNKTIEKSYLQIQSFLFSIILLFLISTSAFIFYLNHNKIKFLKLKEEASLNKIKLLQSAMNPHFLFNTFGTLQHYVLSKESLKANEYLTKLSVLIRNIFQNSNQTFLPFSKELTIIKSYISLEQERFKKPFVVQYMIAPDLRADDPLIPLMIIQPYVENAIKHGFVNKNLVYHLTLKFKKEDHHLICEIIDDGIGRRASLEIQQKKLLHSEHLSVATKNTRERLFLLKKVDGLKGSIHIKDLYNAKNIGTGTLVIITLPIKKNL